MTLTPRKRAPGRRTHNGDDSRLVASIPQRYEAFLTGELKVTDLDDEEIFRGQVRNAQGDFRGRPPKFIPAEFATALQQEVARRFNTQISGLVPDAMKAIQTVLNKAHPQPGDGAVVNAAFKVLERFAGKVPDTVNLKAEIAGWEEHMKKTVKVRVKYTLPEEDIEDAVLVEDDEQKEIES